jgi:uncharacterized protein (UPF0335 family)
MHEVKDLFYEASGTGLESESERWLARFRKQVLKLRQEELGTVILLDEVQKA